MVLAAITKVPVNKYCNFIYIFRQKTREFMFRTRGVKMILAALIKVPVNKYYNTIIRYIFFFQREESPC